MSAFPRRYRNKSAPPAPAIAATANPTLAQVMQALSQIQATQNEIITTLNNMHNDNYNMFTGLSMMIYEVAWFTDPKMDNSETAHVVMSVYTGVQVS